MSDDLKKLANVPVPFPVAGRKLLLAPMRLLAALRAQEIVEPFASELAESEVNVTRLMMRHATRLFELAVVMLAGPDPQAQEAERAWLAGLESEADYDDLLSKLIEVNNDFFARRVQQIAFANLRAAVGSLMPPGQPESRTPEATADEKPAGLTP